MYYINYFSFIQLFFFKTHTHKYYITLPSCSDTLSFRQNITYRYVYFVDVRTSMPPPHTRDFRRPTSVL